MPKICPECKNPYDEKRTGTKITTPKDATVHHRTREIENGPDIGVWYIHE